jgi:hypothetical protein
MLPSQQFGLIGSSDGVFDRQSCIACVMRTGCSFCAMPSLQEAAVAGSTEVNGEGACWCGGSNDSYPSIATEAAEPCRNGTYAFFANESDCSSSSVQGDSTYNSNERRIACILILLVLALLVACIFVSSCYCIFTGPGLDEYNDSIQFSNNGVITVPSTILCNDDDDGESDLEMRKVPCDEDDGKNSNNSSSETSQCSEARYDGASESAASFSPCSEFTAPHHQQEHPQALHPPPPERLQTANRE